MTRKRQQLGMAAAKGGVSGLTKVLVGLLATAVLGGTGIGFWAASDDEDDRDGPTTSEPREVDD